MSGTGHDVGSVPQRALLLSQAGRNEEALRLLGPYLASHPGDVGAWERYGWSALAVKDLGAAATSVTRLSSLAPDDLDTHLLAAYVLGHQGRTAESDRAIERAIELAPDDDRAFYAGAHVHYVTDRVSYQSRRWARRAVALDPADADNQRLMGLVLAEGDWSVEERREAEPFLRTALKLNPGGLGTTAAWAQFQDRTDRPAVALVEWERAARAGGGRPDAVRHLQRATLGWLTAEGTLSSYAGGLGLAFALPLGPIAGRLLVVAICVGLYRRVPTANFLSGAAVVARQARRQAWLAGLAAGPVAVFLGALSFLGWPNATAIVVSAACLVIARLSRRRLIGRFEPDPNPEPEPEPIDSVQLPTDLYAAPSVTEPEAGDVDRLMDAGCFAEADRLLTQQLTADPQDLVAAETQVVARLAQHRPDLAWSSLGRMQAIDAHCPATLRCAARLLTAQGRFAEAAVAIDQAVATDPSDRQNYLVGLRLLLVATPVTAATVRLAEQAVALDPDDAVLRELLARAKKAGPKDVAAMPGQPAIPVRLSPNNLSWAPPSGPAVPGPPPRAVNDPMVAAQHAELSGAGHAITTGWAINIVGVPAVIWPVFFDNAALQRIGPGVVLLFALIFWVASLTGGIGLRSLVLVCRINRQVLMTAVYSLVGLGLLIADLAVPLSQFILPMVLAAVLGGHHCLKVPDSLSKESLTRRMIG